MPFPRSPRPHHRRAKAVHLEGGGLPVPWVYSSAALFSCAFPFLPSFFATRMAKQAAVRSSWPLGPLRPGGRAGGALAIGSRNSSAPSTLLRSAMMH